MKINNKANAILSGGHYKALALTFPLRWPDSTISGSFADNVIDDAQPHDEADDTQPIWDSQVWFN